MTLAFETTKLSPILQLLAWMKNHAKTMNIKVREYTWIKEWLPDFADISVNLTPGMLAFSGRGTDRDPEVSIAKATVEAMERAICHWNGIHTNGVAADVDPYRAMNSAQLELFERDRFFCHYLTKVPFRFCERETAQLHEKIRCKDKLSKVDIKIYEMRPTHNAKFALCVGKPAENSGWEMGGVIGLGASANFKDACEKAAIETLRNISYYFENGSLYDRISIDDFKQLKTYQPMDHRNLALHPPAFKNFGAFLQSSITEPLKEEYLGDVKLEIKPLACDFDKFKNLYIKVYRATSPDLQNAFWGPTTDEKLNMNRLSAFAGRELSLSDVEMFPHPLG